MLIHSLTILLTLTLCSAIQPFYANTSIASRTMTSHETTPTITHSYTTLTLTSCSAGRCTIIPTREIVSTYSSDVEGTTKVFTTHHPIPETTVVTITSCSDDVCSTTSSSAILSTYSGTDARGETTSYTTYCPIESAKTSTSSSEMGLVSSLSSTETGLARSHPIYSFRPSHTTSAASSSSQFSSSSSDVPTTTLVTITSCSDKVCSTTSSPAIVSTFSGTNSHGVSTVYTTYCPITESHTAGVSPSSRTTLSLAVSSSKAPPGRSSWQASPSSSLRASSSSTSTLTDHSIETPNTTHVSITSCSDNVCSTTSSPAIVSTFSGTDSKGVATVYTTYCPITETSKAISSSSKAVSRILDVPISSSIPVEKTTHVTVTSCSDNVCSTTSSPVVVSTFSGTDSHGVSTIYTTYCPISETSESSAVTSKASSARFSSTESSSTGSERGSKTSEELTSSALTSSASVSIPMTTQVTSPAAIVSEFSGTYSQGSSAVYTTHSPTSETSESDSRTEKSTSIETTFTEGTRISSDVSSAGSSASARDTTTQAQETTHVTITSCSDNRCATTSSPALVSTVSTTDSKGVSTVYTTYCPISESKSLSTKGSSSTIAGIFSSVQAPSASSSTSITEKTTADVPQTTHVTLTSCSDNICSTTSSPAIVSMYSSTNSKGVSTVYTTYCPITPTGVSESSVLESSMTATTATSSATSSSIMNVSAASSIPSETSFPETTRPAVTSCSGDECFTESSPPILPTHSTTDSSSTTTEAMASIETSSSVLQAATTLSKISESSSIAARTTHVLVTSCVDNICSTTSSPALESTFTSTNVNGVSTVYTTYCPITSETSSSTKEGTSCSGTTCSSSTREIDTPAPSPIAASATNKAVSVTELSTMDTPVSTGEGAAISTASTDMFTDISCSGTLCSSSLSTLQLTTAASHSEDRTTTIVLSTQVTQTRQSTGVQRISTYQGAASKHTRSFLVTVLCGLVYMI